MTWRLVERPLGSAVSQATDYGLDRQRARRSGGARLRDGRWAVARGAGRAGAGRLAALLDVEREALARRRACSGTLPIDRAYRRQGLGPRSWSRRALDVGARARDLRAVIVLETQTNNLPACRFYQAMGFKLCGIDDHFYSNNDIGVKEVAIFWWYEL